LKQIINAKCSGILSYGVIETWVLVLRRRASRPYFESLGLGLGSGGYRGPTSKGTGREGDRMGVEEGGERRGKEGTGTEGRGEKGGQRREERGRRGQGGGRGREMAPLTQIPGSAPGSWS